VKTAFMVHVSPLKSSLFHTRNTLGYAEAMIATNRADREKKAFRGTEAWFPKKVSAWVGKSTVANTHVAMEDSFHLSCKMFGAAWINDIVKRKEAAGGTEADAIYDAFHKVKLQQKKRGHVASTSTRKPSATFLKGNDGGLK